MAATKINRARLASVSADLGAKIPPVGRGGTIGDDTLEMGGEIVPALGDLPDAILKRLHEDAAVSLPPGTRYEVRRQASDWGTGAWAWYRHAPSMDALSEDMWSHPVPQDGVVTLDGHYYLMARSVTPGAGPVRPRRQDAYRHHVDDLRSARGGTGWQRREKAMDAWCRDARGRAGAAFDAHVARLADVAQRATEGMWRPVSVCVTPSNGGASAWVIARHATAQRRIFVAMWSWDGNLDEAAVGNFVRSIEYGSGNKTWDLSSPAVKDDA